VLRKEPQVFATHFDFRPNSINQHKDSVLTEYYEAIALQNAAFLVRLFLFWKRPSLSLRA